MRSLGGNACFPASSLDVCVPPVEYRLLARILDTLLTGDPLFSLQLDVLQALIMGGLGGKACSPASSLDILRVFPAVEDCWRVCVLDDLLDSLLDILQRNL